MADYPPFMNAYGLIPKILGKIKEAKTPTHFTQDFLADTLGFPGGSARAFIPLAKRLGLVGTDGTPTELYGRFRNSNHSKGAMAQASEQGMRTSTREMRTHTRWTRRVSKVWWYRLLGSMLVLPRCDRS